MPRPLSERAKAWVADLPLIVGEDPDLEALLHCADKEYARLESYLEWLHLQTSPATATLAGWDGGPVGGIHLWEYGCGLAHDPALTEEQARTRLLDHIANLNTTGSLDELQTQAERVSPGVQIVAHEAGDPTTPAANVLRFRVAIAPSGGLYAQLRRRFLELVPAQTDVEVVFQGGFTWDVSEWDLDGWA